MPTFPTLTNGGVGDATVLETEDGIPVLRPSGLDHLGSITPRQAVLDPVAVEALKRVLDHSDYKGKARKAAAQIYREGLSDEVQELTARLKRTRLDEVSQLLLAQDDVYGALILRAFAEERDHAPGDDDDDATTHPRAARRGSGGRGGKGNPGSRGRIRAENLTVTGLFDSITRDVADLPRALFEGALVQLVFERNHVEIETGSDAPAADRDQYKRVLERVRSEGVPISAGVAEDRILEFHREVARDGQLPSLVDAWANFRVGSSPRIPRGRLTPAVKAGMVRHLSELGIHFDRAAFQRGAYNAHFAVAFDAATRSSAQVSDPIALTRPVGPVRTWDFQVETFDSADLQGVVRENILAAGALDYVYCLGELLGVYKLADALVLRWAAGLVDIEDSETSSLLYRYWQLRDDRLSPEERGMLYKRVLNKGDTEVLSRMVVNENFPGLWHKLMGKATDFIEMSADASIDSSVSRVPVYRATQELQYNLTEHATGMAHMQVTDMYMQLRDAFDLLGAPEITEQLSAGRRKGVWATIERLWREEFETVPDIAGIRTLAVEGNKVFQWVAAYDGGTVPEADFQTFRDAAEAWIIAAASGMEEPVESEPEEDEWAEEPAEDDFEEVESAW